MYLIRLSKALAVYAVALFASLVAFGNITDYGTNFNFVHHVFMMDTIFENASIKYRAIDSVWLHHLGYIFIICLESLTAILCWLGGTALLRNLKMPARIFNQRKVIAICGLTLGFLTWQVAFMSIGGEWFGMWMSKQWNGVPDAFRFYITILIILVYLSQRDAELDD